MGRGERPVDSVTLAAPAPDAELVVTGDVDLVTCPVIDQAVAEVLRRPVATLTLDLDGVSFMGSTGLASLLRAQRLVTSGGGRLRLRQPSRAVRELLAMTHLTDRFEIDDAPAD